MEAAHTMVVAEAQSPPVEATPLDALPYIDAQIDQISQMKQVGMAALYIVHTQLS